MGSDQLFSGYILPITLFVITFGIASSLEVKDFRNVARYPRQVMIGLFAQMIILPIIGFAIAFVWPLPPALKVGLIIIAAAPGGASANLISHLLRGNVALSLSLTAVNSVLILLSLPLLTGLALSTFMRMETEVSLPLDVAIREIVLVTVLPTTLGVLFRTYARRLAERIEGPLRFILPVALALAFLGVIFLDDSSNPIPLSDYLSVFLPTLLLNIGTMVAGFYFARRFNLSRRNSYTICIEVGLHNSALAVFVAVSLLHDRNFAVVPLVYATFSFFSTYGIAYLLKTYTNRKLARAPIED